MAVNEDWTPSSHLVPLRVSQVGHCFVFGVKRGWGWTRRSYSVILAWQVLVTLSNSIAHHRLKFMEVGPCTLGTLQDSPKPKNTWDKNMQSSSCSLQIMLTTLCVALYNSSPDKFQSLQQYARIAINCITFIKVCQHLAFMAHAIRWLQWQQCRRIILRWDTQCYTRP